MRKLDMIFLSYLMLFSTAYAQTSSVQTTTTTPTTQTTVTANTTSPVYSSQSEPKSPLEIEGIYWFPSLRGRARVTDNNQSTDVNFKSDLGLKDHDGVPGANVLWNLGPDSSIRATYMYLDFKGSTTLSRTVVFDGQTYPASTNVNSKLITQYFSLGWLWNFIHLGGLDGGLVLDVKGISSKATLDAPAYDSHASERFTGAAPTPGLDLNYEIIHHLKVFAEVDGIPAGHYGYFLDAQGGLKWCIIRNVDLSVGYREIAVRVDYSKSDSGDLDLKGPFAALTVKF